MSGATIVYAPQLKDRVLDLVPFDRADAVTTKCLLPNFPDVDVCHIRESLVCLRKFGAVESTWQKRAKGGHELVYWRLALCLGFGKR